MPKWLHFIREQPSSHADRKSFKDECDAETLTSVARHRCHIAFSSWYPKKIAVRNSLSHMTKPEIDCASKADNRQASRD